MNDVVTTLADIIEVFQELTNDTHSEDHLIVLANEADFELQTMRDWETLKKVDRTQTATSGQGYTNYKNLPSDFGRPIRNVPMRVGTTPYFQTPFETIDLNLGGNNWYIDIANSRFALTSVGSGGIIVLPYIYIPTAMSAEGDTPSWIPLRFRGILPYKMAEIYQKNMDADDTSYRMSAGQQAQYAALLKSFENFDTSFKLAAMNNSGGYDQYQGNAVNVGDL